MTGLVLPAPARQSPARAAVAALSVLIIVLLIVFGAEVRAAEATSLHWFLAPWTRTFAVGSTVVVGADTVAPLALHITPECTAGVLVVPCVIAFALFTVVRNVPIPRAFGALLLVSGMVFALNQVRIALVAAVYLGWGSNGLWLAHSVFGTLISLAAMLTGLFVQTRVTAGELRPMRQFQ